MFVVWGGTGGVATKRIYALLCLLGLGFRVRDVRDSRGYYYSMAVRMGAQASFLNTYSFLVSCIGRGARWGGLPDHLNLRCLVDLNVFLFKV